MPQPKSETRNPKFETISNIKNSNAQNHNVKLYMKAGYKFHILKTRIINRKLKDFSVWVRQVEFVGFFNSGVCDFAVGRDGARAGDRFGDSVRFTESLCGAADRAGALHYRTSAGSSADIRAGCVF